MSGYHVLFGFRRKPWAAISCQFRFVATSADSDFNFPVAAYFTCLHVQC